MLPVLTVYVMYMIVTYKKRVRLAKIVDAISVQYLKSIMIDSYVSDDPFQIPCLFPRPFPFPSSISCFSNCPSDPLQGYCVGCLRSWKGATVVP